MHYDKSVRQDAGEREKVRERTLQLDRHQVTEERRGRLVVKTSKSSSGMLERKQVEWERVPEQRKGQGMWGWRGY
ncbi:hypothetical protein IE53DRAFT_388619 [Violaceomyces palustris]|uniref:Uncharacterized protein n=1 Tax=Violaceomyces palustris TaxID=1673888 RepID=A0ACD0NTP9_9BASI|nr:hypothetical protein IE53DRAFT_388619 [Violaceomyces palustris]